MKNKLLLILMPLLLVNLSACTTSSKTTVKNVKEEMQSCLNLDFSETKVGRIEKKRFFLKGAVLFGSKAGDYDFRTLHYDFGNNSYFNLTYKEEFGYFDQHDIFRNKLSKSSPGYIGEVVQFPSETTMLDCTVSFSYGGYTVSNTLKVELYGGSEATAAETGWVQKDAMHYTYSYSVTYTDDIGRPTQKISSSGTIDLNSMVLDYNYEDDLYVKGLFSHKAALYAYHYNAGTSLMEIKDSTNSYNVKTNLIYLNTIYDASKYNFDKENGWDWLMLTYVMAALNTFDKLLSENNKNSYVSVFFGATYTYKYLFGL